MQPVRQLKGQSITTEVQILANKGVTLNKRATRKYKRVDFDFAKLITEAVGKRNSSWYFKAPITTETRPNSKKSKWMLLATVILI